MTRSRFRSTGRAGLLACACSLSLWSGNALAQKEVEIPLAPPRKSDAPANFDPADVYFQGWLLSRDAEKLQAEKKYDEALQKLMRARQLFDNVATYFPLWRRDMVGGRRAKTQGAIDTVAPLALEQQDKENRAVAELEGGVIREGQPVQPLGSGINPAPIQPMQKIESLESRRIAELEQKVQDLQGDLSKKTDPNANAAGRDADRARDIAKQRDVARAELKRANDELSQLRAKYSTAPMHEDLQKLTGKIDALERDKAAMGQALGKSQEETREAKEQIAALQVERSRLLQQTADLQRNLESERKLQNDVIAGQQKQLREYQEELRTANDKLAGANQRIASLENQLSEVRGSFNELQEERDSLVRERNQMAELLKLNEGSQVQTLIDQNMGLGRQLREAGDKLKRLNEDNNASLDELTLATRDLAIARGNINDLKREKVAQEQRLADLEQRLRNEDKSLAEGPAPAADPAETAMLRGIIQKQIRIQERRRQSSEILLDAVRAKASEDEKIREALNIYEGAEIPLSPDEMKMIEGRKVDDEFISPVRRSQGEVDASMARLEQENVPYTNAAKRAFLNDRFESCRELFELVLERNPGDTVTRCRLGVVQLRLQDNAAAADTFRRAVELDSNNPYALRMLGYSLYRTGDLGEALKALKESVELAPTNADGRILLGGVYFGLGQEPEAEEQLKSAILHEDVTYLAHLNLAHLYAKQGKKKLGLESYRNAVERGASQDFELEKLLGN